MTEDSAVNKEDLVFRLRERARIRRQIDTRKSVSEGKPDRISDLLEEAALEIGLLQRRRDFLESKLLNIGNYAHDMSTGPAIPDPLWIIRDMSYSGFTEVFD